MTLWEIDIYPAEGLPDRVADRIAADAADLGIVSQLTLRAGHGYLVQGEVSSEQVDRLARELFADAVVEQTVIAPVGDKALSEFAGGAAQLVHVMPKPGVMDPVASSALAAIADMRIPVHAVRTLRKYWISDLSRNQLDGVCQKLLANDSIEQVVVGPLTMDQLDFGSAYAFELVHIPLRESDDEQLMELSKTGQLYLTLVEMRTIQAYFRELSRDPTAKYHSTGVIPL